MAENKAITVTRARLPDRARLNEYLDEIFESGWMTNNGQLLQQLERRLEAYLGVRNLVLVGNGTLALQLAYKLLELRGEIVTTPFSFIATASSIKWHDSIPVFADIDPESFNLDPETVEPVITDRTSALVPVHVYGNPCDTSRISAIAREHNLRVVYDASHAFGIRSEQGSILQAGDISTLSFHATKLFHTVEGGALIIKDDDLCVAARRMINFGFDDGEILGTGINAKMNEFEAAVGLCLLDEIDEILAARKLVHDCYVDRLCDQIQYPIWDDEYCHNYAYFPIVFSTETQLESAVQRLTAANVVPRRYFYPSLDTLEFLNPTKGSVSQQLAPKVLCLPMYDGLTLSDCEMISSQVNQAL